MVFYWFKKILMFKLLLCFWMTFSLVPFPSAADEEVEEGMTLIYPAQYFACAWKRPIGVTPAFIGKCFSGKSPLYVCLHLSGVL